jgi:hypothetical protein
LCQQGFSVSPNRFTMIPKLHYLCHQALRLISESKTGAWSINPVAESVQMQEDFIGRPCRLSRRVNPRACHRRVIDRSLLATTFALQETTEAP